MTHRWSFLLFHSWSLFALHSIFSKSKFSVAYTGTGGACTGILLTQTLEGPVLTVSKQIFAIKGSFQCAGFFKIYKIGTLFYRSKLKNYSSSNHFVQFRWIIFRIFAKCHSESLPFSLWGKNICWDRGALRACRGPPAKPFSGNVGPRTRPRKITSKSWSAKLWKLRHPGTKNTGIHTLSCCASTTSYWRPAISLTTSY